jgi:hypothetical protein
MVLHPNQVNRTHHHHVYIQLDWPHRLPPTNNNSNCLFGAILAIEPAPS